VWVLVVSVVGVGSSLRVLSTIKERQSAFVKAADRLSFSPRYWQQGYIGVRDSSVAKRTRLDP
jgi:hypothetical protein